MHTLISIHFVDRVITLEADPVEIDYSDDFSQLSVLDIDGAIWNFERRHVLYAMQSEVTDEEFAKLSQPEPTEPPLDASKRPPRSPGKRSS
jgi:hypothetical protein